MTQDEIIRMAREAGAELYAETLCVNGKDAHDFIERFAALVAAHEREKTGKVSLKYMNQQVLAEREACAKVCEDWHFETEDPRDVAAAIRARGETK